MTDSPAVRFSGPERILLLTSLVNTIGTGTFVAASVIYFTRYVGLAPGAVGGGLSTAALIAIGTTIPAGLAAERMGNRTALVGLHLLRAVGYAAYAAVGSFATFLVLTVVLTVLDRAASPVTQGLIAALLPEDNRVRMMAWRQALGNVGIGLGAALASVAIGWGSRAGFEVLMVFNGATFAVAGALVLALPDPGRTVAGRAPWRLRESWPDRRYVTITISETVLMLSEVVLVIGLPVWVTTRTSAPAALVGGLLVANTAMAALLQVRLSRSVRDTASAGAAMLRAAGWMAVASILIGLAGSRAPLVAGTLLVAGLAALTVGELLASAGGWHLSMNLAPAERRERYLAFFSLHFSVGAVVGPVFVTGVVVALGTPGWALLAVVFLAGGLLGRRVTGSTQPSQQTSI